MRRRVVAFFVQTSSRVEVIVLAMGDDTIWDPYWVEFYEKAAEGKPKVEIVKLLVVARRKICQDRTPVFPSTEEEFIAELKNRGSAALVWEKKLCDSYVTKVFKPEDVNQRWLLGGANGTGAGRFLFEPIKSIRRGCRAMERYVRWYHDVAFQFEPEGEGVWQVKVLYRGELMREDMEVESSEGLVI